MLMTLHELAEPMDLADPATAIMWGLLEYGDASKALLLKSHPDADLNKFMLNPFKFIIRSAIKPGSTLTLHSLKTNKKYTKSLTDRSWPEIWTPTEDKASFKV